MELSRINGNILDNGSITFKGEIPQIYLDNAFYYICADEDLFSINSAMVICNQEGLVVKSVGSTSLDYGFYSKDMRCIGTETNVTDCIYTQSGSCNTVATVECIDPSKLYSVYYTAICKYAPNPGLIQFSYA